MTPLERLRARLAETERRQRELIDSAEAEQRSDLTDAETTEFRALAAEQPELRERIAEMEAVDERRAAGDRAARDSGAGTGARVTDEADLYRPDGEHGFLSDFYRASEMNDWNARDRLQRHATVAAEQRRSRGGQTQSRAVGTGNIASLSPPQYLVDLYAPLTREGRILADLCMGMQLPPSGMTLTIPRQLTGPTVAPQVNENTALVNQDMTANDLVVPVRTIGGGTDVSRQSLERNDAGVDQLIFADLGAEYALEINEQVAVGTGTTGTMLGILASTVTVFAYTSAAPTPVEFWRKLAGAIAAHRRARKLPADVIVMTPERWAWLSTATDDTGRPLVIAGAQMPQNSLATTNDGLVNLRGFVGSIHGLPVHVDATLPINRGAGANQDPVLLGRRNDWHLWEEGDGTPRELRFEQPKGKQLTVELYIYGYAAFTCERYPAGTTAIEGTGLIQPTF